MLIGDDDGLVAVSPEALRNGRAAAEAKLGLEERWQERLGSGDTVSAVFDLPAPAQALEAIREPSSADSGAAASKA
jgi:hypothetical protein